MTVEAMLATTVVASAAAAVAFLAGAATRVYHHGRRVDHHDDRTAEQHDFEQLGRREFGPTAEFPIITRLSGHATSTTGKIRTAVASGWENLRDRRDAIAESAQTMRHDGWGGLPPKQVLAAEGVLASLTLHDETRQVPLLPPQRQRWPLHPASLHTDPDGRRAALTPGYVPRHRPPPTPAEVMLRLTDGWRTRVRRHIPTPAQAMHMFHPDWTTRARRAYPHWSAPASAGRPA